MSQRIGRGHQRVIVNWVRKRPALGSQASRLRILQAGRLRTQFFTTFAAIILSNRGKHFKPTL